MSQGCCEDLMSTYISKYWELYINISSFSYVCVQHLRVAFSLLILHLCISQKNILVIWHGCFKLKKIYYLLTVIWQLGFIILNWTLRKKWKINKASLWYQLFSFIHLALESLIPALATHHAHLHFNIWFPFSWGGVCLALQ